MMATYLRYKNRDYQTIIISLTQCIAQSLRKGGPKEIRQERFEDSLNNTTSGLTYTALSGTE